jgi:RNA polymerase sigma factor (sigma-70 family)
MNVHVSYKAGKTPDIEREFQHQLKKLERRLQVFKPDLIHLRSTIEQANGRNIAVSLNLRLPSGQMAAQKSGDTPLSAVKAAFADLLSQVNKHKELLRGQWSWKSRRGSGRKQVVEPAVPFEQTLASVPAAQTGSGNGPTSLQADLGQWISANLNQLEDFVDRELQFRESSGQIRDEQISRQEVIDEVMVSALSREDGRAELLSLESWFQGLALQAIRNLITANADTGSVSLDASAATQNVTGSDENVLQYHQPDDRLQEESIIRDQNVRTPEEIFASEEMVAQLDVVLSEVGTADREAFVLYTLEGFTVEEIARLSDRAPELVRKSIQHARERVQQKLPSQNELKRSLLQRSRVA